ncbi:oligosaccharyltransferase complex subunit epsilon [Fusarium irregulare]|uniref:Dolichyl-diphosphooligosaccharide--protein glycosyltransferase subunit OST2 n=1 Tax=Fusarium irregulare TaxID=2494466 RepID=A0A9W8U681_9HYPO|nr:oligosaccharyltransferase complex subunit epsilon [Fusarium irregulare]KAJ4010635.1 oligosaccharyltransferase complex subunit epsilon [Fusarium irregulare]
MAAKKNARDTTAATAATSQASTSTTAPIPLVAEQTKPVVPKKSDARAHVQWDQVPRTVWNHYVKETPQRIKLVDMFLVYLVIIGAIQFFNCAITGTFPFNAFLSGFSATVTQFVLTVGLRLQTNEAVKSDSVDISPERSFAEYVAVSLVAHFFVVNFIN